MSEWQPIDSAPRDGTSVLVWQEGQLPIVAFSHGAFWDDGDFQSRMVGFTHWMPLPELPE